MTKSKIYAALAGIALSFGAIGTSSALTITAGDIKFTIDNYDAGTTGYGNTTQTPACNTVGGCDAKASSPAPGAIGSEDTWGIFSVAAIANITTGQTLFTKGVDGYLIGMFYGLTDTLVKVICDPSDPTDCTTTALATGGKVDVYTSATDYSPDPNNNNNGPGARTGLNSYPGITSNPLYLSADFAPNVSGSNPGYTYQNKFDNTSFAGNGQGFLDVIGGSAQTIFDTNTLTDPLGGKHDLFLTITFDDVNGKAAEDGWTVTSAGQVKGSAIPEPTSLALLGLGLVGLAGMRRRS